MRAGAAARHLPSSLDVPLGCCLPGGLHQHELHKAFERSLRRDADAFGQCGNLLLGPAAYLRSDESCMRRPKIGGAQGPKTALPGLGRNPMPEPSVDRSGSLAGRLRGRGLEGAQRLLGHPTRLDQHHSLLHAQRAPKVGGHGVGTAGGQWGGGGRDSVTTHPTATAGGRLPGASRGRRFVATNAKRSGRHRAAVKVRSSGLK